MRADSPAPSEHTPAPSMRPASAMSQDDMSKDAMSQDAVSKEVMSSHTAEEEPAGPRIRPADGAFGWIPVLATMVNFNFIFGALNAYGVFSTYYLNDKFLGTPASTLSWIGTLIATFMLGGCFLTGALADKIGYQLTAYIGTILCTAAYILASFCNEVWQLILTQGMLFGIGASFLFAPSVAIPSQWFVKRRGLASGVAVSGSSIGGLWFTAATQSILDNLGAAWALRILGILTFVVTGVMNSLYFRRVPPKPRKNLFEFAAAKHLTLWLVSIESFAVYTGYWALSFYIGTTALQVGGTAKDGSNLLLVLNAGSAIGRVLAGLIADKFGNINTLLISLLLTVVIEMPLWMTAKSLAPLYVLCALYGLISPTFISLNPVIISAYFDTDTLASVMGMTNLFSGIGALAGNLSQGEIFEKYDHREQFTNTIIFSAMFILFAGLTILALRIHAIRRHSSSRKFFQKI